MIHNSLNHIKHKKSEDKGAPSETTKKSTYFSNPNFFTITETIWINLNCIISYQYSTIIY